MTSLLNALPGAISQGLIWGIMAIGVYITYKILDIADLTVDGSICHRRRGVRHADRGRLQCLAGAAVRRCWRECWRDWLPACCTRPMRHSGHSGGHSDPAGPVVQSIWRIMGMKANQALSVDKYHLLVSLR